MLEDILRTLPFWILGLGGIIVLLLEVFIKSNWPRAGVAALFGIGAMASLAVNGTLYGAQASSFHGQVYSDPFFVFSSFLIIAAAVFVFFLSQRRIDDEQIESKGEYYGLMLLSTAGAVLFCNARDFINLFLGLEILSMAIYCLCGSALLRRESSESALKYFLLGSFSSAFLLYGLALLYGLSGSLVIPEVAAAIASNDSQITMLALGFIIFGFAFKLGLAPVHFWVPDVYQGAPTSVTAFMATVVKASAVMAFLRVLWIIFPHQIADWSRLLWVLVLMTVIAGNLLALRQRNVKRMLAYSSVAHAGYMAAALLVPTEGYFGGAAVLFYIVSYTVVSLGAFGVLMALKNDTKDIFDISSFYGLSTTHPYLSFALTLFLFALAGLPPGMAGFLGKFYVFSSAISAGYIGLSVVAMLASAVSCYYYLRIIVAMYFMGAGNSEPVVADISSLHKGVLTACVILSVVLGVCPQTLFGMAESVVSSM